MKRDMLASDIPRLRELFREQSFDYQEPDWSKMGGKVWEENGIVRIFELARPTVEMYVVIDGSDWATPGMKAASFSELDLAVQRDLREKGYTDQHCWIPPVCKAFTRRLVKMYGWIVAAGPENWLGLVRKV